MIVAFRAGDGEVAVDTGSATLAEQVGRLFTPFRVDGEAVAHVDLRIEGGSSGYRIRPEEGEDREDREELFGSVPDLLSALEYRILLHLLPGLRGAVHLHASGALAEGGAIVALGPSGAGKSSLALAWAEAGLPLLSDDTLLLRGDGRVEGIPRLVKVHRSCLVPFGVDAEATVAADPGHEEVWYDPARGGGWAPSGGHVPVVVAHVRYRPGSETRVDPLTEAEGLRRVLDNVLDGGLEPVRGFDALLQLATRARLYDVRFGSAADAASRLRILSQESTGA